MFKQAKERRINLNLEGKNIGFAFTGSFCTLKKTIQQLELLSKIKDITIIPVMSYNSYTLDTKFGKAKDFIEKANQAGENACGS